MKIQIKLLCSTLLLVGQAFAATTWTLGSTPTTGMTVAGYANTGGSNTSTNAANNAALQTIQTATTTWYSGNGLGVKNADYCSSGSSCDLNESYSPEHSIDNQQRYDMVLLSFTSKVMLTGVKLGWFNNDSDITVMAYTGAGIPTLVNKKYDELTGWSSIGNYSDLGTAEKTINAASVISSYWLIGAYNPLANPGGGAVTGGTSSYDYIKLASVTSTVPPPNIKVPEPGTLLLAGLALLGVFSVRRRQT